MKKGVWIAGFIVAGLVGMATLLYGLRGILIAPELTRVLAGALSRQLGVAVTIGRISGTYLSNLQLEDIRAQPGEGPVRSLRIGTIRADYSLVDLAQGVDVFLANLTVRVREGRMDLDLTRPAESPGNTPAARVSDTANAALPALPPLPKLFIHDFRVSLRSEPVTIPEARVESRADASRGMDLRLEADTVRVKAAALAPEPFSLTLDMRYTPERLEIKRLWMDRQPLIRQAWMNRTSSSRNDFDVVLLPCGSRLTLSGFWTPDRIHASFLLDPMDTATLAHACRLPPGLLAGTLQAEGRVDLPVRDPPRVVGSVSLRLERGRVWNRSLDRLVIQASAGDGRLRVERGEARHGRNDLRLTDVSIPAEPLFAGRLASVVGGADGTIALRIRDLDPWVGKPGPVHPLLNQMDLRLAGQVRSGILTLTEGRLDAAGGQAEIPTLTAGLAPLAGAWKEVPFQLRLTARLPDLKPYSGLVGLPGLQGSLDADVAGTGRLGEVKGSVRLDVKDGVLELGPDRHPWIRTGELSLQAAVSGPVDRPALQGEARMDRGQFTLSRDFPSFQDLHVRAAIDTRTITIRELTGGIGGAPFSVTGSVSDYALGIPRLDTVLHGNNILLYRTEGLRVRADADLQARGPVDRLRLTGDVKLTEGLYSQDLDFLSFLKGTGRPRAATGGLTLFSLPDPPLNRARFRIGIGYREPFRIKNSTITGSARPELMLRGSGKVPYLTGTVYLDPSRVGLPAGTLEVTSGVVRFLESSPDYPRLNVSADATMQGYDIGLAIQGTMQEPEITLSSLPPLPQDELLLLLLTGQPPASRAGQGFNLMSAVNVAVYLGRGVLGGLFGGGGGGESWLDRVQVDLGQNVTRTGQDTIQVQVRLAEGWPGENSAMYLTSERDVYDDYNAGLRLVFKFK